MPILYQVVLEHVYLSVLLCVVGGAALVVDDRGGAVVLVFGGVGVEDVHGALFLGLRGLCGVLDLLLGLVLREESERLLSPIRGNLHDPRLRRGTSFICAAPEIGTDLASTTFDECGGMCENGGACSFLLYVWLINEARYVLASLYMSVCLLLAK